jgi:predicted nucleic acid-binding protein
MDNSSMRYYFDTSALLKTTELMRFKQEMGIESVKEIVKAYPQHLYLSKMTTLECYDVFRQAYRSGLLGEKPKTKFKRFSMIRENFERNLPQFEILPINQVILDSSINILLNHADKNKIGSNDAIHIAFVLAQQPQMTMVTFDRPMKNVCDRLDIPVIFPNSDKETQAKLES